jgi:hypothetical protein
MRPVTKFEVAFPKDLLKEIKKRAGQEKAYVGEFIVSAVEGYMMGPHEVTASPPSAVTPERSSKLSRKHPNPRWPPQRKASRLASRLRVSSSLRAPGSTSRWPRA